MNMSHTTAVLSAELLEEKEVPLGVCENAGQPDGFPVVVGYADDEDEEDEEEEDEDLDDLDEDEDDEELDDEELDDDWKEVDDDDDEDEDEQEEEEDDE